MPFAGYSDFAACVQANQGKDDPDAYCGSIEHQVEDKAALVLAETAVSKAIAGRVLRKHKDSQGSTEHHQRGGSAPKLPPSSPQPLMRDVLGDAKSLGSSLPREVVDQFNEDFEFAQESGNVLEMQEVLDTWKKDPWGGGRGEGRKRGESEGRRQGSRRIFRAVTKAIAASTETILSLHDTPNSPHSEHSPKRGRGGSGLLGQHGEMDTEAMAGFQQDPEIDSPPSEHAKEKGTDIRGEFLSKPPSLTPGDEAVEPGQSGGPPTKLDPKDMAQAVRTLDIGGMDSADQGELVAEHLGIDPEEAIKFFEGKKRKSEGARQAAQTRRRGRPRDYSYYD